MSAIETGFQNPSDSSKTGWLGFATNVWQEQAVRWNASTTCSGGLSASETDDDTKDGLSNAEFLALSARLARYTGNSSFGDMAETVYTWAASSSGLIASNGTVFNGLATSDDCKTADDKSILSANAGAFILGAAHMFNFVSFSPFPLSPLNFPFPFPHPLPPTFH